MGLFSKKKVYVASTAIPLVLGTRKPIVEAVNVAIQENSSVGEMLTYSAVTGIGNKLNSVLRYGRYTYSLGLPDGVARGYSIDLNTLKSVLEVLHPGASVAITRARLDEGSKDTAAFDFLRTERDWDSNTGYCGVVPLGTNTAKIEAANEAWAEAEVQIPTDIVTIKAEIEGTVVDGGVTTTKTASVTGEVTGITFLDHTLQFDRTTLTNDRVNVIYNYVPTHQVTKTFGILVTTEVTDGSGTTTTQESSTQIETIDISIEKPYTENNVATVTLGNMFYVVEYTVDGANNVFVYDATEGTEYPQLNVGFDQYVEGNFFPIVPVRTNGNNLPEGDPLYSDARKLLRKIGIKIEDLHDAINENPDVDDIDHAFALFGVNLQSEERMVNKYLIDLFSYLGIVSPYDSTKFQEWELSNPIIEYDEYNSNPVVTGYNVPITPPPTNAINIQDDEYRCEISFTRIEEVYRTGSIGAVGTVAKETTILPAVEIDPVNDWDLSLIFDKTIYETSFLTLREQTGTNVYKEVVVHGLKHVNYVYRDHTVDTTLADSLDKDNSNFVIPLNTSILSNYSMMKRNELGVDVVNLVFNSYEVVKLKWYQTSFFRFVMMAVALYFGQAQLSKMLASISTMPVKAAVTFVLNQVFKFLGKLLGEEISLLIALVAMVYLGGKGIQNGGSLEGVPWAEDLLMLVNGLNSGIQTNIQEELKSLESEYKAFESDKESKLDKLEEANELLEVSGIIDPFLFIDIKPYFNPDETPEEFYNRTIHAGNTGAMAIEAITNYVESKLTLPDTRQMIEESLNSYV